MLADASPGGQHEVIVTFTDEVSAGNSEQLLPTQAVTRRLGLVPGFSASLNAGQIAALARQPGVVRIEDNFSVQITNDVANDDFGTALARTDYSVDGSGVGICVVDTGYDPGHEQLDDPGKLGGWIDIVNGQALPYDDQGHGTHVAATAAGSGTGGANAAKYRGVAPGATIYAAKALNSAGSSVADSVEQGMAWCVGQSGVDIISLSLGTTTGSDGLDVLSQAANAAVDAGKIVVVAAGNSGDAPSTVGSPGAAEKAITVGAAADWSSLPAASNHSNGPYIAPFSSRGPTLAPSSLVKPDVAAPGVTIASAAWGSTSGYAIASGTSMATPFVAGTIALMLDADGTLTPSSVKSLVGSTAIDRGPVGKDNHWGWGLIDGYALVSEASGASSYSPTTFPSYASIPGSVAAGDTWSHQFALTGDDLGTPIAATILLDGAYTCIIDWGPFGCFLGEWSPDLEARLLDPAGAELALSECPARGDCGAAGQQETLHAMPTEAGTYTVEVFPVSSGGSFNVYLSAGSTSPPASDASPPSVVVSSPGEGATVSSPVSLSGSASDDVGVVSVVVEIYNRDTTEWWNGSAWQPVRTSVAATLGAGSTSRSWSYGFDPPSAAVLPYWVTVRAFDGAGNPSAYRYRNFTVSDDASPPSVVVSSPGEGATVSSPVSLSGSASDDVGVVSVVVEIYNRDTTEWWNGSAWQPVRTSVAATLGAGSTSRSWSYGFDPPSAAVLPYWVTVRAFDGAGNPSAYRYRNFTVSDDASPPSVVVSSPGEGATVSSPVSLSGSASDDVGVVSVVVEIYNRDTTEWWNGSAWQPVRTSVAATLGAGSTSRSWSYGFDPPSAAVLPYWVTVRAFDGAGNPSAYRYRNFTVSDDASPPSVVVSSPGEGATVSSPVSLSGSASDDVGVVSVVVEIYNRDTTEWWNGSAWQPVRTSVAATLGAGSTSRSWSYGFDPPSAAVLPYWVTVRAFDGAGNPSAYRYRNFTVSLP